jgi:hypothetical protein
LFLFNAKGLPPTKSDKSNSIPSAASSVSITSKACFLSPPQEIIHPTKENHLLYEVISLSVLNAL